MQVKVVPKLQNSLFWGGLYGLLCVHSHVKEQTREISHNTWQTWTLFPVLCPIMCHYMLELNLFASISWKIIHFFCDGEVNSLWGTVVVLKLKCH